MIPHLAAACASEYKSLRWPSSTPTSTSLPQFPSTKLTVQSLQLNLDNMSQSSAVMWFVWALLWMEPIIDILIKTSVFYNAYIEHFLPDARILVYLSCIFTALMWYDMRKHLGNLGHLYEVYLLYIASSRNTYRQPPADPRSGNTLPGALRRLEDLEAEVAQLRRDQERYVIIKRSYAQHETNRKCRRRLSPPLDSGRLPKENAAKAAPAIMDTDRRANPYHHTWDLKL